MWKKAGDISVRVTLLISMTGYGVAPAAATLLDGSSLAGVASRNRAGLDVPEVEALLAALATSPQEQTVDNPTPRTPTDNPTRDNRTSDRTDRIGGDRREEKILLNRQMTRKIVRDLRSVGAECSRYDTIYRIDCLRQGFDMIAASLPDNSEYREAKQILKKASQRLGRIQSKYQDRTAPKLEARPNANPRFKKRRSYAAIRRAAVPAAMAQARDVIAEATTELLRSGENSERRYAHYQEISVAINSTKVLLRSG